MKDLIYSELLALYGGMLTAKQYVAMEQYYHLDLSLSEIAESQNVSRQAIHAMLLSAQKTLLQLEEKIGLLQKSKAIQSIIVKAKDETLVASLKDALATISEIL